MRKLIVCLLVLFSYTAQSQTLEPRLDSFIHTWLGRPYRFGGKTERGIDCSQFSKRLYKDVYGLLIGDNCEMQWKASIRISKDSLRIGDVVFFNSRVSPSGWHCGVYIGERKFVHASNYRDGVKISSLDESMYMRLYKGAGRF